MCLALPLSHGGFFPIVWTIVFSSLDKVPRRLKCFANIGSSNLLLWRSVPKDKYWVHGLQRSISTTRDWLGREPSIERSREEESKVPKYRPYCRASPTLVPDPMLGRTRDETSSTGVILAYSDLSGCSGSEAHLKPLHQAAAPTNYTSRHPRQNGTSANKNPLRSIWTV